MKPVNQIELLGAILKELDRQGFKDAESRYVNACIRAADEIVAEYARESVGATPGMGVEAWLASDDVGQSSRYLCGVLRGLTPDDRPHPHDPADIGRCFRMLDAIPLREAMEHTPPNPQTVGPVWSRLIAAWGELERLYDEEMPTGRAPKLYARMRELISNQ